MSSHRGDFDATILDLTLAGMSERRMFPILLAWQRGT